jgi:hypothetical protein
MVRNKEMLYRYRFSSLLQNTLLGKFDEQSGIATEWQMSAFIQC